MTREHYFTEEIMNVLRGNFGRFGDIIFRSSYLIQYINIKTRSAHRGSKARGSFANLYAIYVLVEDYVSRDFDVSGNYIDYEGAIFTSLFKRQRELPFGSKLQNHALNHRMNEEFKKYFPDVDFIPIIRDNNRYWINEGLMIINIDGKEVNIARSVIEIIDAYIAIKKSSFERFIDDCRRIQSLESESPERVIDFIVALVQPNVDARIFEIVSYSILKYYYVDQVIYFGFAVDDLQESRLLLYKTGRTNANDGGIDFVMRPLGRFFQVTETLDVKKYFLDIDKIERYPVTFVVKSVESIEDIMFKLKIDAERQYPVRKIIERYMSSIEEIINIPEIIVRFRGAIDRGYLNRILNEIITQSRVEFNYDDEVDEDLEE